MKCLTDNRSNIPPIGVRTVENDIEIGHSGINSSVLENENLRYGHPLENSWRLYLTYTDLFRKIQQKYPTASRTTVLKRLRKMVENHILIKYDSGKPPDKSRPFRNNRTFYRLNPDKERELKDMNNDDRIQHLQQRKSEYDGLTRNRRLGHISKSIRYRISFDVNLDDFIPTPR